MVRCGILLRRDRESHQSVCSMPGGTLLRRGCLVPHCVPAGLVCTIAGVEELLGLPYRLHMSTARHSRACPLSARILLHAKQLRSGAVPCRNVWQQIRDQGRGGMSTLPEWNLLCLPWPDGTYAALPGGAPLRMGCKRVGEHS